MREYRRDYFTFCEFNFKLDKIARIKSTDDYSENISDFFGSDDDIFVENLFDFDWPDMDGILELYDIIAPPSDIEIKTAGNNSGLGGRSSGRFQNNKRTILYGPYHYQKRFIARTEPHGTLDRLVHLST